MSSPITFDPKDGLMKGLGHCVHQTWYALSGSDLYFEELFNNHREMAKGWQSSMQLATDQEKVRRKSSGSRLCVSLV